MFDSYLVVFLVGLCLGVYIGFRVSMFIAKECRSYSPPPPAKHAKLVPEIIEQKKPAGIEKWDAIVQSSVSYTVSFSRKEPRFQPLGLAQHGAWSNPVNIWST